MTSLITSDRIELSDADVDLLAQASRLMSEALDRSCVHRIALVEDVEGRHGFKLEVPPATLHLLSQILALMARQQTFIRLVPE